MLSKRMQIQAVADKLAGLPGRVEASKLQEPWATCWRALDQAADGNGHAALTAALSAHPEREQIVELILSAKPGYTPQFQSLQELARSLRPIEWLWPGWIPRGMLTLLGAAQGSGKSFLALDLGFRIIHGKGFPDGAPVPRAGAPIIYVDAEMVPQILNERAEHYQVDRSRLYVMLPEAGEMIDLGDPKYQERLGEMCVTLQPELIIVDSLSSIHSKGQNNVEDVRALLGFLTQTANDYNLGLLLIHHIRKPGGGQQSMLQFNLGMEDLSGSGHITAMARVVMGLHVVQTGPEFDPNGPRELKMLKTNLGPYRDSLGFEFAPLQPRGVYLKWLNTAPETFREPTKLDEVVDWLEKQLMTASEPQKPKDLVDRAVEMGYSRALLYRARELLTGKVRNTAGRKSPDNCWKWVGDDDIELDDFDEEE